MQGSGRPGALRQSAPPMLNPWANPYLPFAQRLAATVSGSWAGTFPLAPPRGFGPVNNQVWNGWPQASWTAVPQPLPGFNGYAYPENAYPMYAAAPPIYAPPPPLPLIAPIPAPVQNIAERSPAVQISPRHAIAKVADDQVAVQEADSNEDCPAVVELRDGSVYTATRYWESGKQFHFITTRFDHYQVPLTLVGRIVPRKPGPDRIAAVEGSTRDAVPTRRRETRKPTGTSNSSGTTGVLH